MGRRVWPHEIAGFLRDNRLRSGPTPAAFWGAPQDGEEEAMLTRRD
jgi:anaerobic magnesium-protoporphyrin IX monomethyl ester cyclase